MNELTCPRLRGGDECQSAVYKERAKKKKCRECTVSVKSQ